MSILRMSFLAISCLCMIACSSIPSNNYASLKKASLTDTSSIRNEFYFFYSQWKGVPHQDGGMSKNGVDCSGLMVLSFSDVLGIQLPRTTIRQSKNGVLIDQSELKEGDLVFFQTGFKQLHVGVYLGQNQFMHASSSRGVMISRLDNPYWRENYWHSRRIIR